MGCLDRLATLLDVTRFLGPKGMLYYLTHGNELTANSCFEGDINQLGF